MKPYKDSRKYHWKCPFKDCDAEFYSGGAGHLESQVCAHLMNVHKRLRDAGHIMKHAFYNTEWVLEEDVAENPLPLNPKWPYWRKRHGMET